MSSKPLIVKALPRFDQVPGFQFFCPWCKRWHLHGIGEGHRGEHCSVNSDSPFLEMGYVLKRLSKVELRNLARSIVVGMSEIERRRLVRFAEEVSS